MMKVKALALAALSLMVMGSAHAGIARGDQDTGDSELVLVLFDDNASYTKDLGVRLSEFDANSANNQSWALGGDKPYADFLAQVKDPSQVQWAVLNGRTQGDILTTNDLRLLTTIAAGDEAKAQTTTVNQMNDGNGNLMGFVGTVGGTPDHAGTLDPVNVSSFNPKGTSGYFVPAMSNFKGFLPFSVANATGTSASFAKLGSNDTDPDMPTTFKTYGTMSLSPDALTFTSLSAPVPEPETYALLIAGLGVVGAAMRRRARS